MAVAVLYSRPAPRKLNPKSLFDAAFPKSIHTHSSTRVDMRNALLLFCIGLPLSAFVAINALAMASGIADLLSVHYGARSVISSSLWVVVTIQFLVYFVFWDFAGYVEHYWYHTWPALWNFHKGHHTAETLTPWTALRLHPVELIFLNQIPTMFGGLVLGLAMYLTGTALSSGTVTAIGILTYAQFFLIDVLSHSHAPISYGWLDRIILAPVMHNVHHSAEPRHRDKNLAVIFTFWDLIFGTIYLPKKGETYVLGCNPEEIGEKNPHKTLSGFYMEPLIATWASIKRVFKTDKA